MPLTVFLQINKMAFLEYFGKPQTEEQLIIINELKRHHN